ncbi:Homeodomain-like protein [Akanthomyces lecanii RCEF 1005]|uniref:Homeodomain-like protein n=1 Tax=Akanthomyces lecanii RCEF 1005 TaxID=1081108 RepID=A0A168HVA3_CORDF|nr:Homeodomain-like protein [Akanthomyces lecanii RCEF 1005]
MRQADIGEIFKVERSTVSKVLRNKEMYLKGEVEKDSNGKRTNGKNPDFERTLGNYIRKQREHGLPMSDTEIMDRARQYARGSPNHQAILAKLTPSWLNKFKLRYSIDTTGGALRRASEPSIPEKLSFSARFPDISPTSPSAQTSPLSVSPSDDDLQSRGKHDFTYRQFASQSETSLTNNATSFSSELISPVGPFGYSPDGHSSGFPLDPEFEAEQKRNGSFHSMEVEYASQMHSEATDSTLVTPRNAPPPCKQESPVADTMASIPSMRLCGKKLNTGVRVSPTTPSPEDAQRAAATLLNYLQNLGHGGQFEHEYSTIMKLTMKLDIHTNHFPYHEARGLARIAEGDGELIAAGGGDD